MGTGINILTMDPHSHNLLEGYYNDGNNTYHYNALKSDEKYFRVDFTRVVTEAGINITINQIKPVNSNIPPTEQDVAFLTSELQTFQGIPHDGNECVTLGWTYLGNSNDNAANINAAITECESKGHKFIPLFYQSGYFVFGCVEDKLFYDKRT